MSDHLFETDQLQACIIYYDVIIPTLCMLSILSIIFGTYKYAVVPRAELQDSGSKYLHYLGLIFFIFLLLTFMAITFTSLTLCHHASLFPLALTLYTQLYMLQCLFLLAFLCSKLYFVFAGSLFASTRRTLIVCGILYAITVFFGLIGTISYTNYSAMSATGTLFVAMACLMVIVMAITLNVMFIGKLVQVYRHADSDQAFVDVVTKTSLLALISTGSFLLLAVFVVLGPYHHSFHVGFVEKLCLVADCATNFWCTLLTYRYFDVWYKKMCCDAKCKAMWFGVLRKDEAMMCADLQSTAAASSAGVSTTTGSSQAEV